MASGKLGISDDLDDEDPFEGLDIGADAPEPTQEEMDEWATLDTPDESTSPKSSTATESKTHDFQFAEAPVALQSGDAPVAKTAHLDTAEKIEIKKEQSLPGMLTAPASEVQTSRQAAATEPQATAPETCPATSNVPVAHVPEAQAPRQVELLEITPALSPSPVQRDAQERKSIDNPQPHDSEEEDEEEPFERPQQRSGGGWGVGWGTSWGLGALGGKLREVAAGAVRDVKDLTETFQAALADVTGAEDEEEEARKLSARDREEEEQRAAALQGDSSDQRKSPKAQGAASGSFESDASSLSPTDAPRPAAEPAREPSVGGSVAAATRQLRQRNDSGGHGSAGGAGGDVGEPAADPALEAGLQAIDAQVEQLATGAARALTSLWGGLSSVAKVVAAEVVASVADVQGSEAVRGVAQIGSKLAHTAERGLETVGRTAMVLLEEVAGVGAAQASRRRIWGEEADARAADMGREPSTFQDFFYIYGGEQLSEEVQALSNECAHLCNKSRSKLEADQQQALDEALARLGPYFDNPMLLRQQQTDSASSTALPPLEASSKTAAERLAIMYDPIGYLCQDSQSRAEAFLHQLQDALVAAATRAANKARAAPGGGEEDEESEGEEEAAAADPAALLASFRLHVTKRLAEVATAQLQLLANLGASLSAPARTGSPAPDGVTWPSASEQQAALLAAEAARMLTDIAAITTAYTATLTGLAGVKDATITVTLTGDEAGQLDAAEGKQSGGDDAVKEGTALDPAEMEELASEIRSFGGSARGSIEAGYKGLLYAVLLRSLVTQIAQQEVGEAEVEGATEGLEGKVTDGDA